METENKTEKQHSQKCLNLFFDFGKLTTDKKIKAITRIQKVLKITFDSKDLPYIEESQQYSVGFILTGIYRNYTIKSFTIIKGVHLEAIISDDELAGSIRKYPETLEYVENDEKIIIVQEEQTLIRDLEILSGKIEFEQTSIIDIAKQIGKKIKPTKQHNFELFKIPVNLTNEKVFENTKLFLEKVEHVVRIKKNSENPIVFFEPNNKIPYYNELNFSMEDFQKFVFIEGYLQGDSRVTFVQDRHIHKEKTIKKLTFYLEDGKQKWMENICCETVNNIEYFNSERLTAKSKVRIQGFLKLKQFGKIPQRIPYLEIVYAEILKRPTERVQVFVARFNNFNWYYENCEDGVWKRGYSGEHEICKAEFLLIKKPIILINVFLDPEDKYLYELSIGKAKYFGYLGTIIEKIKEENKDLVSDEKIHLAIKNIVRILWKEQEIIPKRAYTYCGIHTDESKNLILAIPQTTKIKAVTYIPNKIAKSIERADIIIPKESYDENEIKDIKNSLMNYVDVFNFQGINSMFKIVLFGYSVISPFFKALSKSNKMDVFPCYFSVGEKGCGKTSDIELFHRDFYALQKELGSTVDSPSRLRDILGGSTFAILIDEIDAISGNKKVLPFLKGALTGMMDTGVKTKNQDWIVSEIRNSFIGTANTIGFLNADDALKEGRSQVTYHRRPVDFDKWLDTFEKISFKIQEEKVLGFFFLQEAINFIREYAKFSIPEEEQTKIKNDVDALVHMIFNEKKEVKRICSQNNIRLSDTRRLTINAYLLVGLKMWKYVISKYLVEYEIPILDQLIEPMSNPFCDFMKDFERINTDSKMDEIDSILSFIEIEFHYQTKTPFLKVDTYNQIIYLTTGFKNAYNDYARKAGITTYRTRQDLEDAIMKLQPTVERKKDGYKFYWDNGKQDRGAPLFYEKIIKQKIPDLIEDKALDIIKNSNNDKSGKKKIKKKIMNHIKQMWTKDKEELEFEDIYEPLSNLKGITKKSFEIILDELVKDDQSKIMRINGKYSCSDK